jgi:hypothetical protein
VLTINNDATGGWTTDDVIDVQAIGSGTFTLVQGTATLTTDSGASIDSTTAVGKRVQAQRIGTSAWRTISPVIVTGGSGAVTVIDLPEGSVVGASATNATLSSATIPANTFTAGKQMHITAFIDLQTNNLATFEVLYGSTVLHSQGANTNSFGGAFCYVLDTGTWWALTNSSQKSNTSGAVNTYLPGAAGSATEDATTSKTLTVRVTTSTGTTAIQLRRGKIVIL